MSGPQNQLLNGAVEFFAPRGGYVGFRGLPRQNLLFGPAHAGEHWCIPREIAVDADSEIHLRGRDVGAKPGHHAEDGVGAKLFELLKQVLIPFDVGSHYSATAL